MLQPVPDEPARTSLLNRELGQLAFNQRVLEQAEDDRNPLLERLKFLCIVSSNLDEFYEIRVAGLKEQMLYGRNAPGPDGLTPREVMAEVARRAHALVGRQYALLNDIILPALARQGIRFLRRSDWTDAQRAWVHDHFLREIFPVLTPIGLDPAHPFPRILNKSLNFAVELEGKDAFGRNSANAIVQAPRVLPRVIRLPREVAGGDYDFVFLSSMLHAHVGELFGGMRVVGCYQFRVTRNSELYVEEEEVKNLRLALQGELPHRHYGDEVRLEVAQNCSPEMSDFLLRQFELSGPDLFRVDGPVNLVRLMRVPDWVDRPDLKFRPFRQTAPARLAKQHDVFAAIRGGDILLHHPFESFKPVVDLIRQAADDPQVLAIKQTVYRAGTDSELIDALISAAARGKEVTVVVELLARFDEEANLHWASKLENAGAHVVYGVFGYKTHAKMAMIVRREGDELRRYVHLGTGNYHSGTTKVYTDFGLFTCHPEICDDVGRVFQQITGLGWVGALRHLMQAPFNLHSGLADAIAREARNAREGRRGRIVAKLNALIEPQIVQALYDASCAGVSIDLVVRGVCALRPGIPGLSENIRVRSVIGRFLEHSRIYYFLDDRRHTVYIGSADWMERNFFRRIEVCVPVLDRRLKNRIIREGLRPYLKDNVEAWEMDESGQYRRRRARPGREFCAQQSLLARVALPEQIDAAGA